MSGPLPRFGDTIAAPATAPGRGAVGIVRVSGTLVATIARGLLGHVPPPRHAHYGPFLDADGRVIDQGLALFFPAPRSFTGEDILELQGHGGPVVLDLLLARVIELGARLARPGEFSERAFLNDKIDLAQAEAIADLIGAVSEQAARAALRSLQGELSARVHALVEELIRLRLYVEAAIDFPDEELDLLAEGKIESALVELVEHLDTLVGQARQGCLLGEGMTVVIAGRPNVGKSSLLNALAARESAIVTAIPGTTRDVLRESITIDGMPLHVIDTAGLRDSADPIEQEGIRRAWAEIGRADRVLLVIDDRHGIQQEEQGIASRLPPGPAMTVVRNKVDLSGHPPAVGQGALGVEVALSALSGAGLDLLREHLKACIGYRSGDEGTFLARRRHLDALRRTGELLRAGIEQLRIHRATELLAEDLRLAQEALGEITGEITADDLLGRIFSSFCIGK